MATAAPPVAAPRGDESWGHLPSRRLLLQLLESTRVQTVIGWSRSGATDCTWLARLDGFVHALARQTERLRADDESTRRFLDGWAKLDAAHGDPEARGWSLPSLEASRRLNLIEAYLLETGPTSLVEAEADAPKHYWPEEELEK